MGEKDVLKEKGNITIVTKPNKASFDRCSLKKFYIANSNDRLMHLEAFLDFFDNDSLLKKDKETGCYISHLICMDGYEYSRFDSILKYLFDNEIISPFEVNDKGQLFIDCMFQTNNDYNWSNYVYPLLPYYLINYSIDINNLQDFNGNNVAHHLIVNCPGKYYKDWFPFFSQGLLRKKNNNGISVLDLLLLSEELCSSNTHSFEKNFIIKELEKQIVLNIYKSIPHDFDEYITKVFFKDEILLKLLNNKKFEDVRTFFPSENRWKDYEFNSYKETFKHLSKTK